MGSESFYPILGEQKDSEKVPIPGLTTAPAWIQNPTLVSPAIQQDKTPIDSVIIEDLDEDFVANLRELGISHWFPVQRAAIPIILKDIVQPQLLPPRDICVSAPTGSGKTYVYAIPIIQALRRFSLHKTRALIMLPVQDLAVQVFNVLTACARGSDIQVYLMTGQRDLASDIQNLQSLRPGPDIIVATPGRLMDHLVFSEVQALDLTALQFLVIDEADRMMTETRLGWLSAVETAVYDSQKADNVFLERRKIGVPSFNNLRRSGLALQKILLSATLSQDPTVLREWNLFQPMLFTSASDQPMLVPGQEDGLFAFPAELSQSYVIAERENLKPLLLFHLLGEHKEWTRVLCFVESKQKTQNLCLLLKALGLTDTVAKCTGDMKLTKRNRILSEFSNGKVRVLVCSDLVARGLDVDGVDCVINYSPPKHLRTYTHRVGRTARAGMEGSCYTLATDNELVQFKEYLEQSGAWNSMVSQKIKSDQLAPLYTNYKEALKNVKKSVQESQDVMKSKVGSKKNGRRGSKR